MRWRDCDSRITSAWKLGNRVCRNTRQPSVVMKEWSDLQVVEKEAREETGRCEVIMWRISYGRVERVGVGILFFFGGGGGTL